MIKLSFAKKGLCLIKGLRLLILEKIYKAMFIQGATFIREVRVTMFIIIFLQNGEKNQQSLRLRLFLTQLMRLHFQL